MKKYASIYLAMFTILILGVGGCTSSEKGNAQVQKLLDTHEIQNLMSRRAFYHSGGRNDLEFQNWSKRDDISWGQNQGFQIGQTSIKKYYVTEHLANQKKDLEKQTKLYPQLNNDEKNIGAGGFVMHSLTTPIIEVAGDGQTAKGVWYTPGALAMTNPNGTLDGMWMWERYAVDFIKEDGKWKFWHILILTDFAAGFGKPLETGFDAAPIGNETRQVPKDMPQTKWDIPIVNYYTWGPVTVQGVDPKLPEPYQTFSETFSYGPPAEAKKK
jgi:hypothetical protein